MSYTALRFVLLGIMVVSAATAGAPLATITSGSSFELSGVNVPVASVPSWPLVAGDEVATTTQPAVLLFQDRSRVTLDKNSRAKLEQDGKQTRLRLLRGALKYSLAPASALRIFAADRPAPPTGSTGVASVQFETSAVGFHDDLSISSSIGPLSASPFSPRNCRNPDPGNHAGRSPCSGPND